MIEIALPPLRERDAGDLELLALHFLREACRRYGRSAVRLSAAATTAILAYAWPGNVRELENAIESAVVLADAGAAEIRPEALPPEVTGVQPVPAVSAAVPQAVPQAVRPLADVERAACEAAVRACGGNRSEAARLLRIGRNTLARKLRG
ncbi:MAG: hypothetical protein FJ087_08525 [Deltaproteobacteria bacterium]|nr:hypothetical protein [Deltaproteobacteria bacterium]